MKDRLLWLHQLLRCVTSSPYRASLSLLVKPITVVSSANLMMWFELCLAAQSWVRSVNSTQPWGTPVFGMVMFEILFFLLTAYSLPTSNSRIQPQRVVFTPSWSSFFTSCCGVECWAEDNEQHENAPFAVKTKTEISVSWKYYKLVWIRTPFWWSYNFRMWLGLVFPVALSFLSYLRPYRNKYVVHMAAYIVQNLCFI